MEWVFKCTCSRVWFVWGEEGVVDSTIEELWGFTIGEFIIGEVYGEGDLVKVCSRVGWGNEGDEILCIGEVCVGGVVRGFMMVDRALRLYDRWVIWWGIFREQKRKV